MNRSLLNISRQTDVNQQRIYPSEEGGVYKTSGQAAVPGREARKREVMIIAGIFPKAS